MQMSGSASYAKIVPVELAASGINRAAAGQAERARADRALDGDLRRERKQQR